jgi:hypothetical protein|eukprot:COSAG06_NODE_663_length_13295_cov_33.836945_15_plen_71_part_00
MLSEDETMITWGKTARDAKGTKKGMLVSELTDVYLGTKSALLTQRSRQGLIVRTEQTAPNYVQSTFNLDV